MYRLGLAHSFHVCFYFSFFSVYFCTIYIFIIIIIIIPACHGQTDVRTDEQNCYINIAHQCADAR